MSHVTQPGEGLTSTEVNMVAGLNLLVPSSSPIAKTGATTFSDTSGGNNFVYNEIVSGSGTTFTLAYTPVAGMFALFAQGQRLYPTGDSPDYTLAGAVITTVNSWLAGNILCDYQH
jgi:hypothetical protein